MFTVRNRQISFSCVQKPIGSLCKKKREKKRQKKKKNHAYSAEQTDLVLPKTYRLDEKFVDTAENQPLKVSPRLALRVQITTSASSSLLEHWLRVD